MGLIRTMQMNSKWTYDLGRYGAPMFDTIRCYFALLLLLTFVTFCLGSGAMVEEAVWRVSKSSGDASVTTTGQWLALAESMMIKPGDNLRTGQTGQVLLKRG